MRAIVMLMFLFIAGTCRAEDPLETLNTVEDTLSTMERVLNAQADGKTEGAAELGALRSGSHALQQRSDHELYFVSAEPLGARGWVSVRPCPRDGSTHQGSGDESCAGVAGEPGGYFWQSREAAAADLRPGVAVISQQEKEGTWILARVTDVSLLPTGSITVSAPFKVPVKGLRVVEE